MLVEGPRWWTEKVLKEEGVELQRKILKIEPYIGADAGLRLKSVWVKVIGFPMKLWSRVEFEKLVDPFGVVFELDSKTRDLLSFKEAKLRLGVTYPSRIPASKEISFMTEAGEWRWCEVKFITDNPGEKTTGGNKRIRVWVKRSDPPRFIDPSSSGTAPNAEMDTNDEDLLDDEADADINQEDAPKSSENQPRTDTGANDTKEMVLEVDRVVTLLEMVLIGPEEKKEDKGVGKNVKLTSLVPTEIDPLCQVPTDSDLTVVVEVEREIEQEDLSKALVPMVSEEEIPVAVKSVASKLSDNGVLMVPPLKQLPPET